MPTKFASDKTAVDKAFEMFVLLSRDPSYTWTTSQLKDNLNCSTQTIARMVKAIIKHFGEERLEIGIDGKENTYRWVSSKSSVPSLCPNTTNNQVLRSLQMCRDLAEPYLPKEILAHTDNGLCKLEQFLGDESNEPQQNRPFAFLSKGYIDYSPYSANIKFLSEAIEEESIIEFKCKVLGQKELEHHLFAPSVIAGMNGALYVLGVEVNPEDKSAGDICFFAIHRISNLNLKSRQRNFEMPKIEFEQYGLPWHEPRTYVIHFKAGKTSEWVQERVWSKNQSMRTLENGDLELRLTTTAEPELLAWVRSFGPEAELITQTEALVSTTIDTKNLRAVSGLSSMPGPFVLAGILGAAAGAVASAFARKEPEVFNVTSSETTSFKQACAKIKGEL